MIKSNKGVRSASLLLLFLMTISANGFATHLQRAESLQLETQRKAEQSQRRVEKLDDEAQKMLDEFRQTSLELENIRAYHEQLAKIVQSQEQEKNDIKQQILELEITQRNITPLMLRMLEVIEQIVELGAPFLDHERRLRVDHLKSMMDRSDVALGEKFRRLLEAYMIETDYGRTIEAYNGDIQVDGKTHTVDFLRLGRLGLYYLTLDEDQAGYWDNQERQWEILDDRYRSAIAQGLRIAKKQSAPDLLQLPVSAPEQVQ